MASDLLPIPAGSKVAQSILQLESALQALREAAVKAGVAKHYIVHDAWHNNISLAELRTTGEGEYGWEEYYHYYDLESRKAGYHRDGTPRTYTGQGWGPSWVKFYGYPDYRVESKILS